MDKRKNRVPFISAGEIKYYYFTSLENQGLYHAIFTRHGGFSTPPWQSLNFGASVGDEKEIVIQNRAEALNSINIQHKSVYDVFQIHSTNIVRTDRPLHRNEIHQKADAILTNQPKVTLLMRFADCVPIMLFDPINRTIALIHSGWIGTVERLAALTIQAMTDNFRTNPGEILAAIGPSIGPDHYEVGNDVIKRVQSTFEDRIDQVINYKNNKSYFNLWKANQILLEDSGVRNIEISSICTSCHTEDWYSHRAENGKTGRFGAVLGLL